MLLLKGFTTYKVVSEDDPQFDANNMLHPVFTNTGSTMAIVNDEKVLPGESFVTPENVLQTGKFTVIFVANENPQPEDYNQVMVKYTQINGVVDVNELIVCKS